MSETQNKVEFQCSGCGMCCKNAGKFVRTAQDILRKHGNRNVDNRIRALARFPFKFTSDGACVKLGPNNECTVYDRRPHVCNVEMSFKLFALKGQSKEDYFSENGKICNRWIREAGLPDTFLVREDYKNN